LGIVEVNIMKLKYAVVKYDMPEYETGDCHTVEEFKSVEDAMLLADKLNDDNEYEDSTFYNVCVYKVM
jgi:hypothetical protein